MTADTAYSALWMEMIVCFAAEDPLSIAHTQAVVDYTGQIAAGEGWDARRIFLVKTAALLHDIGCPAARAAHGKSLPPYQEEEGGKITRELLAPLREFSRAEAEWVTQVVGSHHRIAAARELRFEPLFEADLIVNLLEGYYERDRAAFYRDRMVVTASGRRIFDTVFGLD